MLRELALAPFTKGPWGALKIAKQLRAFRLLREDLRELGHGSESLMELQYSRPAEQLGVESATVARTVDEWMYRKPLRHLAGAAWPGLRETLMELRDAGLRLGVFSDYPPAEKLKALGIDDLFEVMLGATDAQVNAFKPHPQGFLEGAKALGLEPADVVYVGDRHDVDGAGAAAAGMRSVILETGMSHVGGTGGPEHIPSTSTSRSIATFAEVPRAVGIR